MSGHGANGGASSAALEELEDGRTAPPPGRLLVSIVRVFRRTCPDDGPRVRLEGYGDRALAWARHRSGLTPFARSHTVSAVSAMTPSNMFQGFS